jgi:hypothetical protein
MIELTKREKEFIDKRIRARNLSDFKWILGLLIVLAGLAAVMTEWT